MTVLLNCLLFPGNIIIILGIIALIFICRKEKHK